MPDGEDKAGRAPEDDAATETLVPSGEAGRRLGPYHLLQRLGEGGMGEVWLAQQTSPVRRDVAVKIIKRGLDTRQVVARFEAERQALALMDHPFIAKVFDAGETPDGRPYFVMEHVRGIPITEHCDRNRLSTRARLALFVQVCEAVQHAHQKAIIHRDLKPSNVLVSVSDGPAVAKIIDFGIAKATTVRLTEKTLVTELGTLIGTPEYMSPEQADLTAQDVDTRTDVYSLGVMLYEMLVGVRPFDMDALRGAGLAGMRRTICETEPPRPSTRLSSLAGEASAESARRRAVDVPTLRRQLTGDLDWITMKCLEKDRSRRYGSVAELAADVERYLTDQPVLASPPSAAYRARKFTRRHRTGVAIAAAAALAVVAFTATTIWQAGRIARQRDRADLEAKTAKRVVEFLTALFKEADPSKARGSTITAGEILDRGARQVESELSDEPGIRAKLMATIGEVYFGLGLHESAVAMYEKSLSLRRKVLGNDHPDTLSAANDLGVVYEESGRLKEAEPYVREALEGRRRVLGNDHPDTLSSINNMGYLLQGQGKLKEAEPYLREAFEGNRRVLGRDDPETLNSAFNLGNLLESQGRPKEAEPYHRDALEGRRRVLGRDHPQTLDSLDSMAGYLKNQGRLQEAESYYREALEGRRRVLGSDHQDTIMGMSNMGVFLLKAGKLEEAEVYARQALEGCRRVLGNDNPLTFGSLNNLGAVLEAQGKLEESQSRFGEAVEGFRRALGGGHPSTLNAESNLGNVYTSRGRLEEADRLLGRTVGEARKSLPSGHRVTGKALRAHGRCLTHLNRLADAEAALLEAHEILVGTDVVSARHTAEDLVKLYQVWGKPDKVAAWKAQATPP